MFSNNYFMKPFHCLSTIVLCLALLVGFLANSQPLVAAQVPVPPADLIVTNATFDSRCNATITIRNRWSPNITNNFYFSLSPVAVTSPSTPQTVLVRPIPGLAGFASVNRMRPNTLVLNATTITVTVDPQNLVFESSEQNNVSVFPVPSRCRLLTPVTPVPTRIPG
jgi:hypothetical protein